MKRLCIFCASSTGQSNGVRRIAEEVGRQLAARRIDLVYGGGRVGLMGAVADAVLGAGGRAIGVMTRDLINKEIAHAGLSEFHIVDNMHERKQVMSDVSDGFIGLPGGPGTFEEIFEQWTWAQLGIHRKPCGFLEVEGFFDPLKQLIEVMHTFGYLSRDHAEMIIFDDDPGALIDRFATYIAPPPKWCAFGSDGFPQP